jgi:His/Glu/Gln/Arg/opine family amino acid ABC transporter permease subunit
MFDPAYLLAQVPALLGGLGMTLLLTAISIVLSLAIGIAGGAIRSQRVPVLAPLAGAYVELIRNTPILVQLFFLFYGLPAVGMRMSLFWTGIVCLTLWGGAYQVENFRGGFAAVGQGMREAALALNLRPRNFLRYVALPIALRVSLPSIVNTAISQLKNSSYLQAIGLAELTFVALDRVATDFRALEMFAALGVIYVGLVFLLSAAAARLERVMNRPYAA